ncbi:MAG: lytic transglycosylase domain-containing protein [Myxococcales bacterium]|nr:lytic transglycosylase domain-containing protein [Myxococcales bacterium]
MTAPPPRRARAVGAALVALAAAASMVAVSCRRGVVEPTRALAPTDAEAGNELQRRAAADGGSAPKAGRSALRPALADARMAGVREALRAHDAPGAARLAGAALYRSDLSLEDRCTFALLAGRLALASGEPPAAAAAFTAAAAPPCPLAPYAKLGGARAALAVRSYDLAAELAGASAAAGVAAAEDAQMVQAEALAASGKRPQALVLWRQVLASSPRGPHWVEAAGHAASTLADGDASAAPEAYALASRVLLETPHRAEHVGARASRARAAGPAKRPVELDLEERVGASRGWLEAGDHARALAESSALFVDPKLSPAGACAAAIVRAQATARAAKSAAQADAWGDALPKCDAQPELVTALYNGAKASVSAKRPQEALARFAEVERRFADHRLADDAALRAALVVAEHGGEAEAVSRLVQLAERYPTGDMRGEALFRAALFALRAGDDAAAKPLLERVDALFPDDRHWATAGRASFFRARIAERAGDPAAARALFVATLERAPLSFYMGRGYAHLAERDLAGARAELARVAARDTAVAFAAPSRELLQSAPFQRALRLLEAHDLEAAKREFAAAHALGDAAPAEAVWEVGALFDQVEAWEIGHGFSRGRVHDHLARLPEGAFRGLWETAYPKAFAGEVARGSATHGVRASLLWGVMREESSFVADIRSPANAYGLMQLIPSTAKWISGGAVTHESELKRPEVSVDLGARLLAKLLEQHHHPALAVAAYNAGSGAVNRWVSGRTTEEIELFVELIPYEETRNYVKRVLGTASAYAYLYDRDRLDDALRLPSRVLP